MKRLVFLVIFFLMISSQANAEYVTNQNFVYGTIGSDYIQTSDTIGSTFTIVYGTNSNTMTGCTDANPCRIVVYDASCTQASSCANREIMDIRTVSSLTFTIDARNAETPTCTSCTFAQGAKWAEVTSAGILNGLPLPSPTTGCVLQSTDGVNYSCPTDVTTTGMLAGGVCTIIKSSAYTIGTDHAYEKYRCIVFVSGVTTITLPAIGVGMSFCIYSTDANIKTIDPNNSDRIRLDGTAQSDGISIVSSGVAGESICLVYDSADGWTTMGKAGTWAQGS